MTAGTMGTFYNSGANSTYVYIYLDGATQVTGGAGITGTTNQTPYGGFGTATLTSGYHYVSMWGAVGAGTGTLAGVSATLDVSLKRAN